MKGKREIRFIVEFDYDELETMRQALWAYGGPEADQLRSVLAEMEESDVE